MFFFVVAPFCSCPASLVSRIFLLSAPGVQSVCFFVALRWAPRPFGGARAKKKPRVFFLLLRPRGKAGEGEAPCRHGARAKKKTPWVVFFFCCGPARTLTHSLRAWVAMPPPRRGGVFFLLRPRPDRGGVFFFAVAPPGRSLTHCGLGRFRQGPGGVFFFAAAPPGLFRQ